MIEPRMQDSFEKLMEPGIRLLCHALQFAFKSIAYYIRRATLINVCIHDLINKTGVMSNLNSLPAFKAPPTPQATTRRSSM
jgi:hypothetical protein